MNWWSRACKIINLLGFEVNSDLLSNVSINKCESWVIDKGFNIIEATSHKVVNANNLMTFIDKSITQMWSNKPTTSGNKDFHNFWFKK